MFSSRVPNSDSMPRDICMQDFINWNYGVMGALWELAGDGYWE